MPVVFWVFFFIILTYVDYDIMLLIVDQGNFYLVYHWELPYHTRVLWKCWNLFNTNIYLYLQILSLNFFTPKLRLTTTCFTCLFNTLLCIIDNGTVEDATTIIADWGSATHILLRPNPIKKLLHSDSFL